MRPGRVEPDQGIAQWSGSASTAPLRFEAPMEIIPFGAADIDNILAQHPEYAERLPYGAIQLDRHAIILRYSKTEGLAVGRDPEDCLGKHFFNDIAPCGKGRRIDEEFRKFIETNTVNVLFDYLYRDREATFNVRINMRPSPDGQSFWLFCKKINIER